MQIVCFGISHKTAPVELRERFAISDGRLGDAGIELSKGGVLSETVIVSTCNRVEYYAAAEDPAQALAALGEFASEHSGGLITEGPEFHRLRGLESIRHLFRVVSGLESMVVGETEILGQVKKAYETAQKAGSTSRMLNKLFQRAFNVAKEVRTQTRITRGAVSVGSVAVDLAGKIFGKLDHCKIMILGAGETAEMTARALQSRGAHAIFVSNRTYERAKALADSLSGKAIHFEEWEREFDSLDILIGSTGAPHAVVTKERLEPLMRRRPDRQLFCIDLAVPRDFEPGINDLDGVYLYDIDALEETAAASMKERLQEFARCEALIERHVLEFGEWLASPRPAPSMHPQAEVGK